MSYNGKLYHGWQIQKSVLTIEKTLENVISILLKQPINIIGAGRTDTGVHAQEMYAHFDFNKKIQNNFVNRLNSFLPKEIKIFNIYKVINKAHARFDATSRTYKYFLSLGKNPFYNDLSWIWKGGALSIDKMNQASYLLMKYNNFRSFCKNDKYKQNYICNIYQAYWSNNKNFYFFTIEANRFLRNMVRSIVGTIVDIGRGKIKIEDFIDIIESKDRKKSGESAPASGLFLTKIKYPENIFLKQ